MVIADGLYVVSEIVGENKCLPWERDSIPAFKCAPVDAQALSKNGCLSDSIIIENGFAFLCLDDMIEIFNIPNGGDDLKKYFWQNCGLKAINDQLSKTINVCLFLITFVLYACCMLSNMIDSCFVLCFMF